MSDSLISISSTGTSASLDQRLSYDYDQATQPASIHPAADKKMGYQNLALLVAPRLTARGWQVVKATNSVRIESAPKQLPKNCVQCGRCSRAKPVGNL